MAHWLQPRACPAHLRRWSCAAVYTCLLQASGLPMELARAALLPPPAAHVAGSVSLNSAVTWAPAAAGGSWNDRAYWLSPGTRRFLEEDLSTNTIGFRCAMTHYGAPETLSRKGKTGNWMPTRRNKR